MVFLQKPNNTNKFLKKFNFIKENRDHKKLLKQDEHTGTYIITV